MEMSLLEMVVSGVIGAILALLIGGIYKRLRSDVGDYELWLFVDSLSLSTGDERRLATDVVHVVGDEVLEAPYAIEVDVWNAGAKDIRGDMFDGGQPIEIALGTRIVRELPGSQSHEAPPGVFSVDGSGTVSIQPGLLRVGMVNRYRLLVDGKPETTWHSSVADLQIHDLRAEWSTRTPLRRVARAIAAALAAFAALWIVVLMLGALLLPDAARVALGDWLQSIGAFAVLPGFLVLPIGFLWMYSDSASTRAKRAAKSRRRGLAKAPKISAEPLRGGTAEP